MIRCLISFTILLVACSSAFSQGGFSASALQGTLGASSGSGNVKNKLVAKTPPGERMTILGDFRVEIIDANVTTMLEKEVATGKDFADGKKYLQLKLKITSTKTTPLPYYSWSFHNSISPLKLKDDDAELAPWAAQSKPGAPLRYISAGIKVGGYVPAKSSCYDIVAFAPPDDMKNDLKLVLPGKNVGANRDAKFTVPAKWFAKSK